jgi:hypothetical protein
MRQRGLVILAAAIVGGVFVAGLFIHGRAGGVLLLLTDAVLITMAAATWTRIRPQGRPLRLIIIAAVAVVAVVKFATG